MSKKQLKLSIKVTEKFSRNEPKQAERLNVYLKNPLKVAKKKLK